MLNAVAFVGAFDETSFLLVGTGMLVALLVIQILWAYRASSGSPTADEKRTQAESEGAETATGEGAGSTDTTISTNTADTEMVTCPECSKPTEAEYRFCRNCAEDTGKSYVGSRGDDGSNRSGFL